MKRKVSANRGLVGLASVLALAPAAALGQTPLGTAFTYQGQVKKAGVPLNGTADFMFSLWDAASAGNQIAPWQHVDNCPVANGLFTTTLDFGAAVFGGQACWLEIGVRSPAGGGNYHILSPRQAITTAPYALQTRGLYVDNILRVGIGESNPTARLVVKDESLADVVRIENTNTSAISGGALRVESRGLHDRTIEAISHATTDNAIAVNGESRSLFGAGVQGLATANTGTNCGVRAESQSPEGYGIYAANSAGGWAAYFPGKCYLQGNVGIAKTNPTCALDVAGRVSASEAIQGVYARATDASGYTTGVYGRADSTQGSGVYGWATATSGSNYGVRGRSDSASGYGVYGHAAATSGSACGVYGKTDGDSSAGVRGVSTKTVGQNYGVQGTSASEEGCGVYGTTTTTVGNGCGVKGVSANQNGYGVYGEATNTTSVWGVYGRAAGPAGVGVEGYGGWRGVRGIATEASSYGVWGLGTTAGVYGLGDPNGEYGVCGRHDTGTGVCGETVSDTGVWGRAYGNSADNVGVLGDSLSAVGCGVYGRGSASSGVNYGVKGISESESGHGVYGEVRAPAGVNYGVYGKVASPNGFAGYFHGKVQVQGELSKSGGSFKIDHPLDPENQYLYHSFVESPDMLNVYNGNVVTDDRGYATVVLPEWFETLNRDFRYQLTVIDEADSAAFVQAKIVHGVANNQFTLRTSQPFVTVSWQVTGIRQDRWANAHRIPVEETKRPEEQGKYLHPELYGAPPEAAVHFRPLPADDRGRTEAVRSSVAQQQDQ
ncbi:MAG: hypothetical protein AB1716_04575 [Planctomycetota bacterium]